MPFASESVAVAFAVRFHRGECVCEGDLDHCAAYQEANAKKKPEAA